MLRALNEPTTLSAGLAGATPVCQGGVSPLGSVRDGYGGSVGVGLYGLFVAHRDRAQVWRTAVVPVVLTGVGLPPSP